MLTEDFPLHKPAPLIPDGFKGKSPQHEPMPHSPPDEPESEHHLGPSTLQGMTDEESAKVMAVCNKSGDSVEHSGGIERGVTYGTLPSDPRARKSIPMCTGLLDYFPDALAAVAACSQAGNDQHNPGEPLHWAREKSDDHPDCLVRHVVERGTLDSDGIRHSAKAAWRALAMLQLEIEADRPGK